MAADTIAMNARLKKFFRVLGPGILFASTCIGVSHLVQSTRAGADYRFALLWAIILANIFKYPFFEFAVRYTSATGRSIIDGYARKGRWIVWAYFFITIPSMVIVTAAVTFVTAGLLENLLQANLSTDVWA
ncbi:MAG TPA: divalent metal cation transporter, partial [Flammeovirgaceae bacterium]|nr:divalent metal cation transporter [Flammeovirgaceae bacterium]